MSKRSAAAPVVAEIPPHDLALEQAVLGAALVPEDGAAALGALRERATETTLYPEHHRIIYRHLCALADAARPTTTSTLIRSLRDAHELEAAGGEITVKLLEANATVASQVPRHADELVKLALKREAGAGFRQLSEHAFNGTDPAGLAAEARALIERLETGIPDTGLMPMVERIGDDFTAAFPSRGVVMEFQATRDSSEPRATVVAFLRGTELDMGTLPLASTTARVSRASKLAKKASGLPWEAMLDKACSAVWRAFRAGDPAAVLVPRPRERAAYLLEPIVPFGQPAVLHSDGGGGKSLLSVAIASSVYSGRPLPGFGAVQQGVRTLLLDWETDEPTAGERAHLIGVEPGAIVYRRMVAPLVEDAAAIRRDVREHGIGLVIVDSLQYAVAGGDGRGDVSTPYVQAFNVLRSLGPNISSLVLAHHSHAGDDKREAHPYGSRFIHNACRARWELRSDREEPTHLRPASLLMGLFHRKSNDDWLRAPLALRVVFDGGVIRFEPGELHESETLINRSPTRQRIAALMVTGALDVETIHERLNDQGGNPVTLDNVRRTLDRYVGKDWIKLPHTKPVLYGPMSMARA